MLSAETRSLYFADLASRLTRQKQWLTGATLFLTSGAGVGVLSKAPEWMASSMALVAAGLSAYSISAHLDTSAATLVKLHSMWQRIQSDYERLWNHTYADEAEQELEAIRERERIASELAATGAPYKEKLLERWQDLVIKLHYQEGRHAA